MAELRNRPRDSIIQGIVSPAGWDKDDQVNAVCIVTDPEIHYYAVTENRNLDLLKFLKKEVSAEGQIRTKKGVRFITVSKIVEIKRVFAEPTE